MYRHLLKDLGWAYLRITARTHGTTLLQARNTMPALVEQFLCGPKRSALRQPSTPLSCSSLGPLLQKNTGLSVSRQRFLHRLISELSHAGTASLELLEKTLLFLPTWQGLILMAFKHPQVQLK